MTKILGISDPHNQFATFPPGTMPDADFVLIAGDFTDWGEREPGHALAAGRWINALADRYRWVYYVLGNHDVGFEKDVFDNAAERERRGGTKPSVTRGECDAPPWIMSLEGRIVGHDRFQMTGINLSPCFDVPKLQGQFRNMTASPEVDAAAFECLHAGADIVVSHCPPLNCLDYRGAIIGGGTSHCSAVTDGAVHDGSPGLRTFIEHNQLQLVVCGHVHSQVGMEYIGKTLVVNTAGTATLITIGEAGDIDVEIIG